MKGYLDIKKLETYKKADLQKLARELGVSDEGTIKEIAARCAAVETDIPDEENTAEETTDKQVAPAAAGLVKVEATVRYLDKQLNKIMDKGAVFTVSKERAAQLAGANVAKMKE